MKKYQLFLLVLCMGMSEYSFSQSGCNFPVVEIISDCGTEFDLCLDSYTTTQGTGILMEVFINDDLGIFDPCESDTLSGTSNGTLTHLPDCNWFYLPDPDFVGMDTFFYILNYQDTCVTQCYCSSDPGCIAGRIWTIDAIFLGDDSQSPTVLVKDKDHVTFSTHENLVHGQDFFVDGSALPPSTTNYEYQLHLDGDTTTVADEIVFIHVSCSEEIFGKTYGFLRPISGCIAGTSSAATCAGQGNTLKDGSVTENRAVAGEVISAQAADTAMVEVVILPILSLDIRSFEAERKNSYNAISWAIEYSEEYNLILEESYDGRSFMEIMKTDDYSKIERGYFNDFDNAQTKYYRLVSEDMSGKLTYSETIIVKSDSDVTSVNLIPNPVGDELIIEWNTSFQEAQFEIFSSNLKSLQTGKLSGEGRSRLILNDLMQPGVYYIQIKGNSEVVTKPFIKI